MGKGSVAYGLGADISLPHCLLKVDRYLKAAKDQDAELVKAMRESKSRPSSPWYNALAKSLKVPLLVLFFFCNNLSE